MAPVALLISVVAGLLLLWGLLLLLLWLLRPKGAGAAPLAADVSGHLKGWEAPLT